MSSNPVCTVLAHDECTSTYTISLRAERVDWIPAFEFGYARKMEKISPFYALHPSSEPKCSICALERWNGFALVLIEGLVNDITILDSNIWRIGVIPSEGVLHPVFVVALQDTSQKIGREM